MPLDATQRWFEERVRAYNDPVHLERLADALARRLFDEAPVGDSKQLQHAIAEMNSPKRVAEGWSMGVGNADRTGSPDSDAPAGTIWEFLQSDEGKQFRISGISDLPGWEPRLAWWFLPLEGKRVLAQMRAAGAYGGPMYYSGAPTPYYFVQDQSKAAWQSSAFGAGLEEHGTHFTERALDEWRGKIPDIVRASLGLS